MDDAKAQVRRSLKRKADDGEQTGAGVSREGGAELSQASSASPSSGLGSSVGSKGPNTVHAAKALIAGLTSVKDEFSLRDVLAKLDAFRLTCEDVRAQVRRSTEDLRACLTAGYMSELKKSKATSKRKSDAARPPALPEQKKAKANSDIPLFSVELEDKQPRVTIQDIQKRTGVLPRDDIWEAAFVKVACDTSASAMPATHKVLQDLTKRFVSDPLCVTEGRAQLCLSEGLLLPKDFAPAVTEMEQQCVFPADCLDLVKAGQRSPSPLPASLLRLHEQSWMCCTLSNMAHVSTEYQQGGSVRLVLQGEALVVLIGAAGAAALVSPCGSASGSGSRAAAVASGTATLKELAVGLETLRHVDLQGWLKQGLQIIHMKQGEVLWIPPGCLVGLRALADCIYFKKVHITLVSCKQG